MLSRRSFTLASLTIVLVLATLTPWAIDAATPAPNADFAAPMSKRQARALVHAAQAELAATAASATAMPQVRSVYFSTTGHHVSNRAGFLDFWRANGQLLVFGYPVSEELVENGRVVQYFERARFEYYPEHADTPFMVQLGLLGIEHAQATNIIGGFQSVPGAYGTMAYFPETGHSVYGEFNTFWEKRGGLPIFGFPISEPFEADGRLVQYFERARLEYYPEDMNSFLRNQEAANGFNLNTLYEVQVAGLGRDAAARAEVNTAPVERLAGVPEWSPGLWPRSISVDLSNQWLTAYEGDLVVYSAPVATGKDGFNTPAGEFAIYYKLPVQTMTGSAGGETWNVPNIPSVMYINGGVALHGTYWHNAHGSGVRMSHGCINLRIDDAGWLYEWSDVGVPVSVHY